MTSLTPLLWRHCPFHLSFLLWRHLSLYYDVQPTSYSSPPLTLWYSLTSIWYLIDPRILFSSNPGYYRTLTGQPARHWRLVRTSDVTAHLWRTYPSLTSLPTSDVTTQLSRHYPPLTSLPNFHFTTHFWRYYLFLTSLPTFYYVYLQKPTSLWRHCLYNDVSTEVTAFTDPSLSRHCLYNDITDPSLCRHCLVYDITDPSLWRHILYNDIIDSSLWRHNLYNDISTEVTAFTVPSLWRHCLVYDITDHFLWRHCLVYDVTDPSLWRHWPLSMMSLTPLYDVTNLLGSLLLEKNHVRLSGQDVERGTFRSLYTYLSI